MTDPENSSPAPAATHSLAEISVSEFLRRSASSDPAPGGGAVGGLIAALGAAAGQMTAEFSTKRKSEDALKIVEKNIRSFESIRAEFLQLMDQDEAAFSVVARAYRLPKSTPEEKKKRKSEISEALEKAAEVPEGLLAACARMIETLNALLPHANRQLAGDFGLAAAATAAAARGAYLNIAGNLGGDSQRARKEKARKELNAICRSADILYNEALKMLGEPVDTRMSPSGETPLQEPSRRRPV